MTMDTVNTTNTVISYHLIWTIWLQTQNLYYTLYILLQYVPSSEEKSLRNSL